MWANPYDTANLVTFTGGSFNEKLHFLCSVIVYQKVPLVKISSQASSISRSEERVLHLP